MVQAVAPQVAHSAPGTGPTPKESRYSCSSTITTTATAGPGADYQVRQVRLGGAVTMPIGGVQKPSTANPLGCGRATTRLNRRIASSKHSGALHQIDLRVSLVTAVIIVGGRIGQIK